MKYCTRCVQTDTRPGIYFNEEGVCGACLHQEDVEKNIDWSKREKELKKIAEWAKKKAVENNCNYDCAIGVSGGKDSTFQALYARDNLGLRPLLVNCEPAGLTEIGKKNIENLKNLGFDTISLRPNPKVMQKLIRKDFFEYLNPVKITEFSLWASTYIIADKFDTPLIIQGENPGLTLGARKGVGTGDDALIASQMDTLSTGYKRYIGDGITDKDLFLFRYDGEALRKKGVRGIWLQYYTKEWSQSHNYEFSVKHGLVARPEYFDPYEIGTHAGYYQLDGDLTQVNQVLKYIKFGFGQCTDHACYDIRAGKITRDEAIELIKKYDGKCGIQYTKKFCDYIGITVDEFWEHANKFRGKMWEKNNKGDWVLKGALYARTMPG